jgi:hypothetical protein
MCSTMRVDKMERIARWGLKSDSVSLSWPGSVVSNVKWRRDVRYEKVWIARLWRYSDR